MQKIDLLYKLRTKIIMDNTESNVTNGLKNEKLDQNQIQDVKDGWGTNTFSSEVMACMPVSASALYYNMNHKNRGLALIFNHEIFDIPNLKQRSGTKVDAENLSERLKELQFEVMLFNNLKCLDIINHVSEVASMDHSNNDCLFIAILSHGEMGIIYSYDTHYKLEHIWSHFTADKCPSLAGKPKLFFIQACQGDKLDGGITMQRTVRTETDGHSLHSYRIPTHADFLIAYSTVPGFYSWRNTTRGSWFIQAFCHELEISGKTVDILTLLTFVSRRVAIDYESNTPDCPIMHQQKQIPCITSMLTRLLVFTEKNK